MANLFPAPITKIKKERHYRKPHPAHPQPSPPHCRVNGNQRPDSTYGATGLSWGALSVTTEMSAREAVLFEGAKRGSSQIPAKRILPFRYKEKETSSENGSNSIFCNASGNISIRT